MYLSEALGRCAGLEERTRRFYEALAAQHVGQPHLAEAWKDLAAEADMRARQLTALAAIHEAVNDDGPFVVGLQRRIDAAAAVIEEACAQTRCGIAPRRALAIASDVESSELRRLFLELRDLARTGVRKLTDKLYKSASMNRPRCRLDRVQRALGVHGVSGANTGLSCPEPDAATSSDRTNASSERQ